MLEVLELLGKVHPATVSTCEDGRPQGIHHLEWLPDNIPCRLSLWVGKTARPNCIPTPQRLGYCFSQCTLKRTSFLHGHGRGRAPSSCLVIAKHGTWRIPPDYLRSSTLHLFFH